MRLVEAAGVAEGAGQAKLVEGIVAVVGERGAEVVQGELEWPRLNWVSPAWKARKAMCFSLALRRMTKRETPAKPRIAIKGERGENERGAVRGSGDG